MDITGKTIMFVKQVLNNSNKPSSKIFTTTISRKLKDGSYVNVSVDLVFSTKIMTDSVRAQLNENKTYWCDIHKGFISVDSYEDKNNNIVKKLIFVVQEGKIFEKGGSDTI